MKEYGYCRISRRSQKIERQIENISKAYPNAVIYQEAFTGTKIDGRKEFNKLLNKVVSGDTIIFDSVSRMSRNAQEGMEQYFALHDKGIKLVFIKEPYINTQVFDDAINRAKESSVRVETGNSATDKLTNTILDALTEFQMDLAKNQIQIAFDQAEKEVTDLHERTKEGIREARRRGAQIGQRQGAKLNVKKKEPLKAEIKKKSKSFNGAMTDKDLMKVLGIANNTYYKYKKELFEEIAKQD